MQLPGVSSRCWRPWSMSSGLFALNMWRRCTSWENPVFVADRAWDLATLLWHITQSKWDRQQLSEYMMVQGNNTKPIKLYQSYDKMDLIGLLCCGIYKGRTRQYFMILTCWQKWVFITVKITPILLLYMETYLVWSGPRGRYLQTSVSRSNFTAHEDRFRLPCDQQAIRYLIGLRPQNEEIVTLLNFHN